MKAESQQLVDLPFEVFPRIFCCTENESEKLFSLKYPRNSIDKISDYL